MNQMFTTQAFDQDRPLLEEATVPANVRHWQKEHCRRAQSLCQDHHRRS